MPRQTVVKVENLRKTYGSVIAVDSVSLEVYEGEIFGLVGPNGADKTTSVECIERLRRPDAGAARVLGLSRGRLSGRNSHRRRPDLGENVQVGMKGNGNEKEKNNISKSHNEIRG